jgi:energy-coupling factor transporter ATP-binding protein EcfA2
MTNNDILKKLRVALQLRDDEIVDILALVDFRISKSEIGAFCRKEGHPKYRECGDQVLRNFLNGLVIHLRGTKEAPKEGDGDRDKPRKKEVSKSRKAKYTGLGSVPYKNKKGPKQS